MAIRCANCGNVANEPTPFCATCGARLSGDASAGSDHEMRKTVTVLFCDVVGSTELGERLDPESVRSIMGRYFAIARRVLEGHGGTVEKFIGDAVMAVFGIPALHEDDAVRAVRAAADLRTAIDELNSSLYLALGVRIAVRMGVNTGEVIAAADSAGGSLVTGDAVNVAARLEQSAGPGEILIGETTQRLVRRTATLEPIEPVTARGKAMQVNAFRLVSSTSETGSQPRWPGSRLVGRDAELTRLRRELDDVMESMSAHTVTVVGTAGIGKSRLVAEFVGSLDTSARVLRGRCLPYGDGVTYFPLTELVRAAAGIADIDSRAVARDKLGAIVPTGEAAADITKAIEAAIGLEPSPVHEDEIFWATRRLIEELAGERQLVVVIEDIHWAEPAFLDLLEYLGEFVSGAAVLLVCLARPELLEVRPSWGTSANSSRILLDSLRSTAAVELLEQLDGSAALDQDLRRRILDAAEGNPLYVEEMLGMLVDEGHLIREDDAWRPLESLESFAVPPTIDALLAARIDGLPHAERNVAERASVIGRVFEAAAVRELMATGSSELGHNLLALVRKELIRPERAQLSVGDAYKFRHVLIRDAAYRALPKAERAALHEQFADWMERSAGDRIDEYDEILGFHLESAHDYRVELGFRDERTTSLGERAARRLGRAGERALRRRDARASVALLERAVRLLPEHSAEAHSLTINLAVALGHAGQGSRALELLDDLLRRPDLTDGDRAAARINRLEMGRGTVIMTIPEQRREIASNIRPLLKAGNARLVVDAFEELAGEYQNAGDTAQAARYYRRAVGVARRWDTADMEPYLVLGLAGLGARTAMPVVDAIALTQQAMALPDFIRPQRPLALDLLAYLQAQRAEFDAARAHLEEAEAQSRELGRPWSLNQLAITRGLVERFARRFAESAAAFKFAYDGQIRLAGESNTMRRFLAARRAQALLDAGALDESRVMLDEAMRLAHEQKTGGPDAWTDVIIGGTRARFLVADGHRTEGFEIVKDVVHRARAAGLDSLVILFANALEDLATCAEAAGDGEAATTAWSEAYAIYAAKGDIADATRLRAYARPPN